MVAAAILVSCPLVHQGMTRFLPVRDWLPSACPVFPINGLGHAIAATYGECFATEWKVLLENGRQASFMIQLLDLDYNSRRLLELAYSLSLSLIAVPGSATVATRVPYLRLRALIFTRQEGTYVQSALLLTRLLSALDAKQRPSRYEVAP